MSNQLECCVCFVFFLSSRENHPPASFQLANTHTVRVLYSPQLVERGERESDKEDVCVLLTPDRGNGPNMKCYSPRKEKKKVCGVQGVWPRLGS